MRDALGQLAAAAVRELHAVAPGRHGALQRMVGSEQESLPIRAV
ncbi:MAG: hypothetical protein JWR06_130, partial [Jatrophihabitans sp.]|nr:hypothetical protein [Jatrophihabitans sp.]